MSNIELEILSPDKLQKKLFCVIPAITPRLLFLVFI